MEKQRADIVAAERKYRAQNIDRRQFIYAHPIQLPPNSIFIQIDLL